MFSIRRPGKKRSVTPEGFQEVDAGGGQVLLKRLRFRRPIEEGGVESILRRPRQRQKQALEQVQETIQVPKQESIFRLRQEQLTRTRGTC